MPWHLGMLDVLATNSKPTTILIPILPTSTSTTYLQSSYLKAWLDNSDERDTALGSFITRQRDDGSMDIQSTHINSQQRGIIIKRNIQISWSKDDAAHPTRTPFHAVNADPKPSRSPGQAHQIHQYSQQCHQVDLTPVATVSNLTLFPYL